MAAMLMPLGLSNDFPSGVPGAIQFLGSVVKIASKVIRSADDKCNMDDDEYNMNVVRMKRISVSHVWSTVGSM
jgi:hypothetical protein